MGILIAMVSLGTVLANVPCGMLAHRVSLRTVLLLTGFLYVVSTCGLVTAMYMGSYTVVYATLVVASLTWGAAFSPLSVGRLLFVQHSLSVDLRPRLMSTVGGVQRWAMVSGPFIAGLATDYIPGGYVAALALHLPLMIGYTLLILSSKSIKRASDELDREQKLLEPADFEDVPRASQSSSCFTLDTRYTGRREENVNGGWSPSGSCDDIANGVIAVTRVIAVTPSRHVIYEQRRGAESVDDIPSSDRGERNDSDGTDRKDGDRGASVCLIRAPLVTERNSLVNLSRSVYDDGVAANKGVANDDDSYVAVADKRKPPNAFSEICDNFYNVVVIGTYSFIMQMIRVNRTMLLTVRALHLGLTASLIGTVLSVSFFVDATLFLVGGYVGERFGMRFQACVASAALGLCFCALAVPGTGSYAGAVAQLVTVSVMFGLANCLGAGLLLSLVSSHAPKSRGNSVLTVMRTMQDAGPLVGSLGAGFLLQYAPFEWTCVLFGAVGMLNAAAGALLIPKKVSSE